MRQVFALFGTLGITGVRTVRKKLSDTEKTARITGQQIDRLGKKFKRFGVTLTKSVTVPLLAAGAASLKFGADFEKAMTNSLAIMGDISDAMRKDLEGTARDVAKTTKFSATEAAEAYFFLASAGLDAAQSMAALPKVAAFAQAGNFDLARATDLLTDAQSALGLSTDDAAENMANMVHVSDVLVKANTLANASVQLFSESLTNKAGAALRVLGKDVEEGAAVLAVYADQGRKGAEAGTALNIVLRDLQKAAINNEKAFKRAKVSVFDSAGEMRNMADIIAELEVRLDGMGDKQKKIELTSLGFTEKSLAATIALLGTSEAIREYEKDLRSAAGTTQEIADKQIKNFWDQLGLLKDRIIDVGITLFQEFQPMLKSVGRTVRGLVSRIEELAAWFSALPRELKNVILGMTAFAVAFGPILIAMGTFISLLKILPAAILTVKVAMLGLNAAILANPFAAAAVAIGVFAVAIAGAVSEYKNLQKEHQKWSVMTAEQTQINAFTESVDALAEKIKAGAASVITMADAEKLLGKDFEAVTKKARDLGFVVEGDLQEKLTRLIEISHSLKGGVFELGEGLVQASKDAKTLADVISEITDELTDDQKKLLAKRSEFETAWTVKVLEQSGKRLELLAIERDKALAEAKEVGASTVEIVKFFAKEADKIRNKAAADRLSVEKENTAKFLSVALSRVEILEWERQQALSIARATGADTTDIELFYSIQKQKIAKEEAEAKDKVDADLADKKKQRAKDGVDTVIAGINQVFAIFSQISDNEEQRIDNKTAKEKEAVLASIMGEEEKAAALENIDAAAEVKKRALRRKAAKQEKVSAIFSIAISTAVAIMTAVAQLGPIVGAIAGVVMAALGIAQIAVVAAKPLPLARGAMIRGGRGGVSADVGEGAEDELVLPMKTGVATLADMFIEKLREVRTPAVPASRPAGDQLSPASRRGPEVHIINRGTIIADPFSVNELVRRIRVGLATENQRLGIV